ncbi:GATA zinc finger domain-containing protein 5 [Chrysoperla carnea]|uniref:GATA zinc finger domain-containing protein 5 n=1 Tax=Chrysoperla carnea TaxID=189513 RepID=UPI001D06E8C3|nr:GATA zinc finger domain-containing protein 5 [Chrysoperla carnea]
MDFILILHETLVEQTTTTILINNNHEEEEVYTTINNNNNNTTTTISDNEQQQQQPQQSINRNTWSRTSLRRSPIHNNNNNNGGGTGSGSIKRWGSFRTTNKRQLGSNALASELYRSSSFNCTNDLYGCSSMTTTYSSMSDQDIIDHGSLLEDDVLDLNHKVEQLQQQVNILTSTTIEQQQHLNNNNNNINNNTNNNNIIDYDQYIKIKTENVTLKLRLDILEEQLHDQQTQQQSKLQKLQENESRLNKLYTQLKLERTQLQNDLYELKTNNIELQTKLQLYKESHHDTIITTTTSNGINYFNKYQDSLLTIQELQDDLLQIKQQHTDYQTKLQELQEYIQKLHQDLQQEKLQNQYLNDLNIELQATIQLTNHLEKGQNLLNINKTIHNNNINNTCLADEFQQMSQIQLQHALKEQQDVNNELRAYIENILLNIVENSPQLLEVKNKQFNINNQISSTTTTTATTTSL